MSEVITPVTVIGDSAIGGTATVDSGDIAVVAGNLSSIDVVSNSIGSVLTNATNIASINTVAGSNTQVVNVSDNMAKVQTVFSNIDSVITDANNITSINTVAASNTQVVNVSNNMTKVQTVYDKLGELNRYYTTFLGTSATDPTLRLDGSAVQTGDLYYSTSMPGMKVKTASGWEASGSGISGSFKFSAGSAAAPSITTVGDEDTGVYFPAANTTALTTNGVARLSVGPTGTVTIGGDTSLNTFSVSGASTFTTAPIVSSTTALQAVFTGSDKSLVSNAITGTGNVVMSASPTLTGTIAGASQTLSGTLAVTGVITATGGVTGSLTGNVTGNVSGSAGSCTGNAATATALATGRTIGITGDVSYTSGSFDGTGNVTGAATLATTGVSAGSYGSTSSIPTITVDAKGRVTSVTSNAITIAAGAVGGGTDKIFWENDQTVTTNYTMTSNKNAVSAGPITVNTGVTVTIPTGGVWTLV
jgi:hypothetical protein